MDDFLSGLDGRLRVSGMLADSIMMGIVNSAMENAYRNSCSREGIMVRLNEKSRFCELAIMQLEWCLKFLQEETEYTNLLESNCNRERLLSDLLETRDRIHNRLMETELMIEEKDRELSERMEIESNLRLALEMKDEDISYLNTALGLERERSKKSKKSMERIGASGLGEVKSNVDEHIQKIRDKLEVGQHNLKNLRRRIDQLISEFDVNGEEGGLNDPKDMSCKLMFEKMETLNLETEFKEMVIDMDILKEKIDSSFKVMAGSVSLFKKILDEERWVLDFERETVFLLVCGFVREVECKFYSTDDFSGNSKSNVEASGGAEMASPMFRKLDNAEDVSLESPSCRSVAQKIKSHEFIIKKKAQEKDSTLKGERSWKDKQQGPMKLKSEKSLDSVKDMISRFNTSVECIAIEKSKLLACSDDLKLEGGGENNNFPNNNNSFETFFLRKNLSESVLGENESKFVRPIIREIIPKQSSDCSYCSLIHTQLSETIHHLREEKEYVEIRSTVFEDIYAIVFSDLVMRLNLYCIEHDIEAQIRDDTYRIIFNLMIKELINNIETGNVERLFMEETYRHALNEVVKDIIYAAILTARNSYEQDLSLHNCLLQSSQINNAIQQLDALLTQNLERNFSSESVDLNSKLDFVMSQLEESNEQDDASVSVNGKFDKELIQLNSGEIPLIDLPSDDEDAPQGQLVSAICSIQDLTHQVDLAPDLIQDVKESRCLSREQEERQWSELLFIMMSLTEFSQKLVDFEVIACAKIRRNITRFEDLHFHVAPLIEQLHSIKTQEVLYQKAFTRQHYNLQTAEAKDQVVSVKRPMQDSTHQFTVAPETQDAKDTRMLAREEEERQLSEFQFIMMSLTEFSQKVVDFEVTTCGKIRTYIERFEDMDRRVAPVTNQLNSIKKQEVLYRKAFTRRCYDLQTAEAEVDLLGDEVDVLYTLIEKLYEVLNHNAPALQYCHGITEILIMMRKQLHGEENTCTTRWKCCALYPFLLLR